MKSAISPKASLGRYQLVRHLASGGMADVVLARVAGIEGFERHVVVKRIRDEQLRDRRFVQMFLAEARLAASLHHHNIVQVHELGEEDGEYFFAMEYVHGEDLRKVLAHLADTDQRMPIDHCVTIGLNTAAALHHAHELRGPDRKPLGIVHCDVSPANILIGLDGDVKVIDFGIATVAEQTTQTGTDLLKGKVAYMSPEQCLGGAIDRRSDVFCLGIVLYELVTVRRLFKGANDFLTMTSITHGEIPPPSTIRPDLPLELEAIILNALAFDPADRYQTADELRSALERFAVRARLQTSATALADTMRGLFGDRVMPWLIEDDEPEISIDFDGDASGVVRAPALPATTARREAPGSLLARARATIGTAAAVTGPPVRAVEVEVAPSLRPARSRWWLAAAALVPLGVVAFLLLRGEPASSSPSPAPPGPAVEGTVHPERSPSLGEGEVERGPSPSPSPDPIPPDPAVGGTVHPERSPTLRQAQGETVAREGAVERAPATAPRKPARRPAGTRPARGVWDRDTLFPPTDRPAPAPAPRR